MLCTLYYGKKHAAFLWPMVFKKQKHRKSSFLIASVVGKQTGTGALLLLPNDMNVS